MSGAHSSLVRGLCFLIHSGIWLKTFPQRFHSCRSFEHRIGNSPSRFGPFAVPNRYHVSPSLIMDGSCTYSTSPETLMTWGGLDDDCAARLPENTARVTQTRTVICAERAGILLGMGNQGLRQEKRDETIAQG